MSVIRPTETILIEVPIELGRRTASAKVNWLEPLLPPLYLAGLTFFGNGSHPCEGSSTIWVLLITDEELRPITCWLYE